MRLSLPFRLVLRLGLRLNLKLRLVVRIPLRFGCSVKLVLGVCVVHVNQPSHVWWGTDLFPETNTHLSVLSSVDVTKQGVVEQTHFLCQKTRREMAASVTPVKQTVQLFVESLVQIC